MAQTPGNIAKLGRPFPQQWPMLAPMFALWSRGADGLGKSHRNGIDIVMTTTLTSLQALLDHLAPLLSRSRSLVGIVGAPGSGKSTLVESLAENLNAANGEGASCAIVPMDGFHYDDQILIERGHLDRKGAPHTYDLGGLMSLHHRLKHNTETDIAIPVFDRSQELSRAAGRLVSQETRMILIEGNYLMLPDDGWDQLEALYDTTIYIDVPEDTLRQRLMQRWDSFGLSLEQATAKVEANDLPNARRVMADSKPTDVRLSL